MNNTSYNDTLRNKSVTLINKYLNDNHKSRLIEKSIYNNMINISKKKHIRRNWKNPYFKSLYISKIRSICTNINNQSYLNNTQFKNRIINDDINCENISQLSPYDIFPENWQKLIDQKIRKEKLKYELKPEAMTDMFKCNRCGSRSCTYYEVQTRSADEPMTQFITCLDCNNHWKQ